MSIMRARAGNDLKLMAEAVCVLPLFTWQEARIVTAAVGLLLDALDKVGGFSSEVRGVENDVAATMRVSLLRRMPDRDRQDMYQWEPLTPAERSFVLRALHHLHNTMSDLTGMGGDLVATSDEVHAVWSKVSRDETRRPKPVINPNLGAKGATIAR